LPDSHTPEQFYQEIDSLYLTGDYTEVLEKTFLLLRFFEESGNLSGEVNCYNILGDVMRAISDYSGSLGYLKKSLELTAQPQDSLLRVTTYCLIAATYFELNQPFHIDSAWKYASLSYRLAKQKADKLTQLRNLNILGMVELFKGRFPSSYTYLRQALDIAKQNRPDDIPLVRVNLSKYYDTTGNRREAISLALQAYAEAKRMNILVYRRLSAFALTEYFNKEGDYRRALKYMTDLFQTTSHILWEKKEGWVFNLKMQTERLRKEHELELLKSQEKKHIDDLNERTYWLILSIVLICGLIFFTILFGFFAKMRTFEYN